MRIQFSIMIAICLFVLPCNYYLFSQVPLVQWDATIGGNATDRLDAVCSTPDGGFLLGGHSNSGISGNKSQPVIGGYDYWIVKVNAIGDVVWDKTFGTLDHDYVVDVENANDGGYIIAGYTIGGISGDKTEAAIGGDDYWIIKLDNSGNIVWQNTIGGTGGDRVAEILKVPGGYVLSGSSDSGISGDKTDVCLGGSDYWMMKINNTGSIVWQFTFGGSLNDYLVKTIKSFTGPYVLLGYSSSGISGDKTEANIGYSDYWVLSIDGAGNIIWQNTIGGSGGDTPTDLVELSSGGFIIGGYSSSNISGDKSEMSLNNFIDCCGPGYGEGWWVNSSDLWMVGINSIGELLWENTMGTTGSEYSYALFKTGTNRFTSIGTTSNSGSTVKYQAQAIDSLGFPVWTDTYFGGTVWDWEEGFYEQGYNYLRDAIKLPDNTLLLAGYSDAIIGDDKTEGVVGGTEYEDYWIIKLAPDTCVTFPMYADYDQDGRGAEYLTSACQTIDGYTINNSNDCNDRNSNIYPDAIEICDGIDNNCDGLVDEGLVGCFAGPEIEIDFTVGGDKNDYIDKVIGLPSGYILGGTSSSTTGEIIALDGESDFIISKVSETGEIIWIRSIGGSSYENFSDIISTADGGYITIGNSKSGISGDKTEVNIGGDDLWILKLDSLGNIIWQNTIGGTSNDWAESIRQTVDGGYLISARSSSGISGDKTEANMGSLDIWMVKLSPTGIIEWQNTIGTDAYDYVSSFEPTFDGGYILAGSTPGGISGDKTSANLGGNDIWILKLSSAGLIVWQKSLGGTEYEYPYKIAQTMDGGFFISAYSYSGVSATKSEESINNDYWVIKLGPTGLVIWENTINAAGSERDCEFLMTADGGYLIAGSSDSDVGYDKTEASQLNPYFPFEWYEASEYDFWLLKLNNLGVIEWQNTIGGNMDDDFSNMAWATDGDIILVGHSYSFISGDKSENPNGPFYEIFYDDTPYEETIFGNIDFWLVKLNYDCVAELEICNTIDDDCNGIVDDGITETISISAGGPTTFCSGGNVLLTASYSGETVQWKRNGVNIAGATSPTYLVTTKGTYTCETTSDCDTELSAGIYVNVQKNPPASITAGGATTFCAGGSVILTANTGAGLSYKWYKDAVLIPGATSINYSAITAGIYKCNVTKTATGCNKNSNAIIVTVPCKEGEELSTISEFTIFPNPNNGTFYISALSAPLRTLRETNQPCVLEIFNSLGQQIHSQQLNSSDGNINETISIKNLSSGIYFIRINNLQQKLIIE